MKTITIKSFTLSQTRKKSEGVNLQVVSEKRKAHKKYKIIDNLKNKKNMFFSELITDSITVRP